MKTTRDLILDQLGTGPRTFSALSTALNISYDALRGGINRLLKAKLIVSPAKNAYSLPSPTGQPIYIPTIAANPKPKLNRIMLVLDNSGSMSDVYGLSAAAQKAFNNALRSIKENANRFGQKTLVSRYLFGTSVTRLDYQVDSNSVQFMSNYNPFEGGTMLFDAVGTAIDQHANLDIYNDSYDVSYLLIVITDGHNNRTNRYNEQSLASLMNTVQRTDRWTITFQLPPNSKYNFLRTFPSIPAGNVTEWEQSERGAEQAGVAFAAGVTSYYGSRDAGETFTKGFYTVNANDISSKDLTKLNNVQNLTKSWTVERECEIADFSKEKLGFYTSGTIYYQLTKDEKLQSYKKILVRKKFDKQIYAGQEARDLLNLPNGQNVKVRVGNLGDYDIFIQSTSVNRKLVRGTKVIYYPGN